VRGTPPSGRVRKRAFASPQVWIALAVGSVGFAGVFATYSYIAPMMTTPAGATATGVTLTLVLFGVGMTLGNLVGGRMADRAVLPAIRIALAAVLALFSLTVHHEIPAMITVLLFGFAAALVMTLLISRRRPVAEDEPLVGRH
jgi:DHA1 family inner membrane transport protein